MIWGGIGIVWALGCGGVAADAMLLRQPCWTVVSVVGTADSPQAATLNAALPLEPVCHGASLADIDLLDHTTAQGQIARVAVRWPQPVGLSSGDVIDRVDVIPLDAKENARSRIATTVTRHWRQAWAEAWGRTLLAIGLALPLLLVTASRRAQGRRHRIGKAR
jgi:hypothetical protein